MKNKIVSCLLLITILSLTGCTWFRQPDPGNQPNIPEQQRPTNPQLPPVQPELRNNQGNDGSQNQSLVSKVAGKAKEVSKVNDAAAIVLGNMAIVGIAVDEGTGAEQREEQVAKKVEDSFSELATVYVTSDTGLMEQISSISERIKSGQPTSELMGEINDIWRSVQGK